MKEGQLRYSKLAKCFATRPVHKAAMLPTLRTSLGRFGTPRRGGATHRQWR
jgi:hypothetical protein